ncbi:hypothetical protein [Comamonas sp. NoAH]|uniref:hypothetical protein n=1 Tax=Comamonas halotolerans TaxID=3041496 RepID=UPI0024E0A697|nr:hypothetical protein [Comamonas sp. NoAH]
MAINKTSGRQAPLTAVVTIQHSDVTTYGSAEPAIDVPGGAIVTGGDITVVTPWNSTITATLKLGDKADDDRYTALAVDLRTAGRTALTLTGYKHAGIEPLKALLAQSGTAATKGEVRITVQYITEGRATASLG